MKKILSRLLLSSTFIMASASCLPVWGGSLEDELLDAVKKSSPPSSSNSAPLTDIEKAIQNPEWQKEFKNALQTNPHLVPEMAKVVGLSAEQYYYLAKFYSPHDDIVDPSRFELETLKGYKLSNPEHFKKIVANVGAQDEQGIFRGFLTYNKAQTPPHVLKLHTIFNLYYKSFDRLVPLLIAGCIAYPEDVTTIYAGLLQMVKNTTPILNDPEQPVEKLYGHNKAYSSDGSYIGALLYEHGFGVEKNLKIAQILYERCYAYYDSSRLERSRDMFSRFDIPQLLNAIHYNRDLRAVIPLYNFLADDERFLKSTPYGKKAFFGNIRPLNDETKGQLLDSGIDFLSHLKYAAIAGNNKDAQDILITIYEYKTPEIKNLLTDLQKKQGHVE